MDGEKERRIADTPPKKGEPVLPYPPDQKLLFLGTYLAAQVPKELLAAVRQAVRGPGRRM